VAGRGGDFTTVTVTFLPALVVVFLACVMIFTFFAVELGETFRISDVASLFVVRTRAFSIIALSGLEGFTGDAGREMYDDCCCGFPGEVIRGDCGKVLELEDFGDKTLTSASRITWETARDCTPAAFWLPRFFGLMRGICPSGPAGAFSLSEYRPSSLPANQLSILQRVQMIHTCV
jgi:hypothetical protein